MRDIVRCRHCELNQFMTTDKKCRRCKGELLDKIILVATVKEEPAPKVVAQGAMSFGEAVCTSIKVMRDAFGFSQLQLAERMGCNRYWISRIENHRATPTLRILEKFAVAFSLTSCDIVTFAELLQTVPEVIVDAA